MGHWNGCEENQRGYYRNWQIFGDPSKRRKLAQRFFQDHHHGIPQEEACQFVDWNSVAIFHADPSLWVTGGLGLVEGTCIRIIMDHPGHEKGTQQGHWCREELSCWSKGATLEYLVDYQIPPAPEICRRCRSPEGIPKGYLDGPTLQIFGESKEFKGQSDVEVAMNCNTAGRMSMGICISTRTHRE